MSETGSDLRASSFGKFFAALAGVFAKDDPGCSSVHVDVPMGADAKRKKDLEKAAPRSLKPREDGTAHSPFPYDANALANMRSDQKPRFLGALTDQDAHQTRSMPLHSLTAMQDRVDPAKVESMRGGKAGKPPLVVRMDGRNYIADGHHRASAAFLDGQDSMKVKFKDLSAEDSALKADFGKADAATVCKVDESLGLVFGFAIVCKTDGEDYFDVQGDHIPEDAMLKASTEFMEDSRVAKEMHAGDQQGNVVFAFPLTTEIAKALGIETRQTGLLIAMKPAPEMLAKFKDGTLKAFSIGGSYIDNEEVA